MLGDILSYAANKAADGAVDMVARKASWFVTGALFLVVAANFAIVAGFWMLEPTLGSTGAALTIAGLCVVTGLICFSIPRLIAAVERARAPAADPYAETVTAVEQEARDVVDYYGAAKVVASAFMLGMGAARSLRGK